MTMSHWIRQKGRNTIQEKSVSSAAETFNCKLLPIWHHPGIWAPALVSPTAVHPQTTAVLTEHLGPYKKRIETHMQTLYLIPLFLAMEVLRQAPFYMTLNLQQLLSGRCAILFREGFCLTGMAVLTCSSNPSFSTATMSWVLSWDQWKREIFSFLKLTHHQQHPFLFALFFFYIRQWLGTFLSHFPVYLTKHITDTTFWHFPLFSPSANFDIGLTSKKLTSMVSFPQHPHLLLPLGLLWDNQM